MGERLTVRPGVWPPGTTLSYRWLRDGVAVPGASSRAYVIGARDGGHTLEAEITGRALGGATASRRMWVWEYEKQQSSISAKFGKLVVGKAGRVTLTVKGPKGAQPTGKVEVRLGSKRLAQGKLTAAHGGKITLTMKGLESPISNGVELRYAGNDHLHPTDRVLTVEAGPTTAKVSLKARRSWPRSGKGKVSITLKIPGVSRPRGRIELRDGSKVVKSLTFGNAHRGKREISLRLKPGKHVLRAVLKRSATTKGAKSKKLVVKEKR